MTGAIATPAFRPADLSTIARWIWRDLDGGATVLGIPREALVVPSARLGTRLLGASLSAPLGVAAGPHTQLAQNIVAAWLCGARFMELKTVQVRDDIDVARPCIDSADETYNCEWSQELRIDQSFDEYAKAWVLIHALARHLALPDPGTVFSTSVGYDLAGIRSAPIQRFLLRMRDAGDALAAHRATLARVDPRLRHLEIPSTLSTQVTLSTMHGCPPAEIERIAHHLLVDLGFHVWVKLNPTLLGPERVRGLLNARFAHDIEVPDAAFAHDPSFDEALGVLERLAATAERLRDRGPGAPTFGIKLSNTLEVAYRRRVFPASERVAYLSGRALHPLTLTLAHAITDALDGRVRISFCGGADALNFPRLVADGLGPVTVCTDLLKPGGYARLPQYLERLEAELDAAGVDSVDALVLRFGRSSLARHAADVETEARYGRRDRPIEAKGPRPLGAFDCIAAPCVEACPAHQEIPAYLTAVAAGDPASALSIIARTNAMPAVTGRACDHPCVDRCVRSHYDAPIAIREIKRFAVESCAPRPPVPTPELPAHADVAIVGAGPGGIATATFLARHGVRSVVLEARTEAGGMVSRTIPGYRMDRSAMAADLDALRALGIEVRFGTRLGRDLSIADLRARHRFVVLALGTQAGRKLGIPGEQAAGVMDALDLLERVNAGAPPSLGSRVLVVGGGNSAIDAARTARRLCPAGSVTLVYRRTRESMPADPDEIRDCLDEGVTLRTLLAPQRVVLDAGRVVALACRPMRLGEPDASGRPRPVRLDGPDVELPCDTLVAAIGQEAVLDFDDAGLARTSGGTVEVDDRTLETSLADTFAVGDLARGPSSIIRAIADGGIVADAIARRLGRAQSPAPPPRQRDATELLARRSRVESPRTVPLLPAAHRTQFEEVVGAFEPTDALAEAARCLECDALCSLCVTVCPNRAMQAYAVTPRVVDLPVLVTSERGTLERHGSTRFEIAQSVQVACIADFCNECGDCVTFCPTAGAPWRDKPRFWISETGFAASDRDAYRWTHDADVLALDARIAGKRHRIERHGPVALYRSDRIEARFDATSWALLGAEPRGAPPPNEPIDLSTCATLLALLDTASALPPPTRT